MPVAHPLSVQYVASFGASTAQGAGDNEQGGFIERLGRLLNIPSLNFGIGGNTTRDMLERLPDLVIPADGLIVVTLGNNDVARVGEDDNPKRVSLLEHQKNVAEIIAQLKQQAAVLYMSQFPVDYAARHLDGVVVESFVAAGLAAAAAADLPCLAVRPHLDSLERWQDLLAADGLHFNAQGHAVLARLLSERITAHDLKAD
jgi:lysophospholipase L1-like esterase